MAYPVNGVRLGDVAQQPRATAQPRSCLTPGREEPLLTTAAHLLHRLQQAQLDQIWVDGYVPARLGVLDLLVLVLRVYADAVDPVFHDKIVQPLAGKSHSAGPLCRPAYAARKPCDPSVRP